MAAAAIVPFDSTRLATVEIRVPVGGALLREAHVAELGSDMERQRELPEPELVTIKDCRHFAYLECASSARRSIDAFCRNRLVKQPNPCPCASGLSYDACCGLLHLGEAAPSAEALMRSRYSAFVLCNEPYLLATWHESTRPTSLGFEPTMKWLGLKIVDSRVTSERTAEVEFVARYRIGGGSAARQHERSRFVLQDRRWFYIDGETK